MGSGVTVLVALYSFWPMSDVTLLHAYQSSPTVLEGTVFATVPLPLRACLVKVSARRRSLKVAAILA